MNPDIRQKLLNYTEAPPASAWEGIAAALEEAPAFAQKLYEFETAPPETAWANIVTQIATPEKRVIPLRTKVFKFAIAAAVLGLIAAGSIFYLKNDTAPTLATQPQNNPSDDVDKNTLFDNPSESETDLVQGPATAIEDDPVSATKSGVSKKALVRLSPQARIAKNQVSASEITIKPEVRAMIDTEIADRYMIATTATGKVVRLPKKAYSDYMCADVYAYSYCRERLNLIQSKMAASVATDFTGFMDLLKKLQEPQ